MPSLEATGDQAPLAQAPLAAEPGHLRTQDVLAIAGQIQSVEDTPGVIALLKRACSTLGADAVIFSSVIHDDATLASYRSLIACGPAWALRYAENGWCRSDSWLRYAMYSTRPIVASDMPR